MSALKLVRERLDKVYLWYRVPSSVKAKAALLYFRGMSLRDVQKYLSDEGYKVSIEAIREWFHSVGKMLKALLVYSAWVHMDETKHKETREILLPVACSRRGRQICKRNVVERWFFPIKHRLSRFYKRFPWNARYETVWSWLASFITLYTLLEVKS